MEIALLILILFYQFKIHHSLFHQSKNLKKIMGAFEDITTEIASIGTSLENIAADIEKLSTADPAGLTAAQAATIVANLRDVATRTKAIADITPE